MTQPIEILLMENSLGDIRLTEEVFWEVKLHNNLSVVRDGVGLTVVTLPPGD